MPDTNHNDYFDISYVDSERGNCTFKILKIKFVDPKFNMGDIIGDQKWWIGGHTVKKMATVIDSGDTFARRQRDLEGYWD